MRAFLIALLAIAGMAPASAADLKLLTAGAFKSVAQELVPDFEKKTGHKVVATFGSGLGTKRQVAAGDPFDVPVVQPPYPEVLDSGHVIASTATPLATVAVGVAVRTGARKPDQPGR